MIEILKELAQIFKDLPEAAIWVAGGILFYKLVIVGSAYGLAKFGIAALKECVLAWKNKPKEELYKVDLEGLLIDSSKAQFFAFMASLKSLSEAGKYRTNYIHASDLRRAEELIEKGKLYEKEKEKA